MSIPKHILELLQKLDEKTLNGKISWKNTSRYTEYTSNFNGGTVTIDSWQDNEGLKQADFAVYNNDGAMVERIDYAETEDEYIILNKLYTTINKSVLKI